MFIEASQGEWINTDEISQMLKTANVVERAKLRNGDIVELTYISISSIVELTRLIVPAQPGFECLEVSFSNDGTLNVECYPVVAWTTGTLGMVPVTIEHCLYEDTEIAVRLPGGRIVTDLYGEYADEDEWIVEAKERYINRKKHAQGVVVRTFT